MIQSKKILLTALIFPIIVLALLAIYKRHIVSNGKKFVLPIRTYDPRDMLSGRYLLHTVDYGVPVCPGMKHYMQSFPAAVCLAPKRYFNKRLYPGCHWFIKGVCRKARFEAGIERYYVPEKEEEGLRKRLEESQGKGSIVISLHRNGTAQIVDLLIDGKSIKGE